jgi:hypothetical protein
MYFEAWNFLFSIDESIQKVKEMISAGKVQISRFSITAFEPLLQLGEFAVDRNILNEEGCYVFIRGTESTMTLDHKPSDWYNRVPFWTGEIDLNSRIVDAKNPSIQSLKDKLHQLILDLELYKEFYGTWGHEIIDLGIFIEKGVSVQNIVKYDNHPEWIKMKIAS